VQPLLSLGAYDIEQQRQSIRSNIQQAPAQWIVAWDDGSGERDRRGRARDQKPRHAGSPLSRSPPPPWITALIESLSDVPWSRVILLPKQLLSSVVYSRLFHPAGAPASQPATPAPSLPAVDTLRPTPVADSADLSYDLTPPRNTNQNSRQFERSILSAATLPIRLI